jgi:hypothetical protein
MTGKRTLTLPVAEKICAVLRLELTQRLDAPGNP